MRVLIQEHHDGWCPHSLKLHTNEEVVLRICVDSSSVGDQQLFSQLEPHY